MPKSSLQHYNMKLSFVHLCDLAFLSAEGKVNIIGIFDQLFLSNFPGTYARFFVVGQLTGVPRSFELSLRLSTIWEQHPPHRLPAQRVMLPERHSGTHTFLVEVANIVFPHPGTYEIDVLGNETVLDTIHLSVHPARKPSGPASA